MSAKLEEKSETTTILLGIAYTLTLLSFVLLLLSSISFFHQPFLTTEAKIIDKQVTTYLQTGDAEHISAFTPNEQAHLEDVRQLLHVAEILFFIGTILLLSKWFKQTFQEQLAILLTPVLAIVYSVPLLIIIPFQTTFLWFHQVFFPQGNFLFPYDSLLIQTYPETFFLHMAIVSVIAVFLISVIKIITIFLLKRKK